MTTLIRPGDIPRRIDFVRWLSANTGMGLAASKDVLDRLIDHGRADVVGAFTPERVAELRAMGVEVGA